MKLELKLRPFSDVRYPAAATSSGSWFEDCSIITASWVGSYRPTAKADAGKPR